MHDLVTQMFTFKANPDRTFCSIVAKKVIKAYPFMKDCGNAVSGYVST